MSVILAKDMKLQKCMGADDPRAMHLALTRNSEICGTTKQLV